MNATISIIVPVYRVEEYLDQCVESLVNQTYQNLEILLVDDGSPDRCGVMCDAWAERDTRIKVLHKENGGLSDARNAGMAVATGEYIGFVDSDDWLDTTMYEKLLHALASTDSDIAACGVQMVWEDGRTQMLTRPGEVVLSNEEAMEAIVRETSLCQPVWYKLYRRSQVKRIPFARGKVHEDVFWSYQAVAQARRVCVFDEPLYFYRQRAASIMGEGFSAKRLDALEGKLQRLRFLEQHYPALVEEGRRDLFFYTAYLMQKALAAKADGQTLARLRQYAKQNSFRPQNGKDRVWFLLGKWSFDGMCGLRNVLGIGI